MPTDPYRRLPPRNPMIKKQPPQYVYRKIYLIDGVRVSKRAWEARRIWGEYIGAMFEAVEVRRLK